MTEDKECCFARIDENTCNALVTKRCQHCRFYQHRADIKNNPFYAFSYKDIRQLKSDIKKRKIRIKEVIW